MYIKLDMRKICKNGAFSENEYDKLFIEDKFKLSSDEITHFIF